MEFRAGSKLILTSDFLLSPSPVSPWGLHRAWPGRKATRPRGALCVQVGRCVPRASLLEGEGFCVRPSLDPGHADDLQSFQVLRPGTQCQNLCILTALGSIPHDATFQATI